MIRKCLLFLLILSGAVTVSAKDFTKPPSDTAEAARLRIWVPVERQACQTRITVLSAAGDTIRHFLQEQLAPGYYNYYWDKRDDSNKLVPAGTYQYRVFTCNRERAGRLTATYVPGELDCDIDSGGDYNSLTFRLHVLVDTTTISLEVYDRRDSLIALPLKDSSFTKGDHTYTWRPDSEVRPGIYKFLLTVRDFPHVIYRRYTGK